MLGSGVEGRGQSAGDSSAGSGPGEIDLGDRHGQLVKLGRVGRGRPEYTYVGDSSAGIPVAPVGLQSASITLQTQRSRTHLSP